MRESDFAFLLANMFLAAALTRSRHDWMLWALWTSVSSRDYTRELRV